MYRRAGDCHEDVVWLEVLVFDAEIREHREADEKLPRAGKEVPKRRLDCKRSRRPARPPVSIALRRWRSGAPRQGPPAGTSAPQSRYAESDDSDDPTARLAFEMLPRTAHSTRMWRAHERIP